MKNVRNVVFDLGGVLLEWNPRKILARCHPDTAAREILRDALFRHEDWLAFNRGDLSEPELLRRVNLRAALPLADLERALDIVRDSLVQLPETVALLQELHERGIPLYCLSDMPLPVFAHVRQRYSFWNAFRGIVVSGEVRMMKPTRAVFEHLLSQHRLQAEETLFIDDHPPNIAGAKAVGLEAILFRSADQCRRELAAYISDGVPQ